MKRTAITAIFLATILCGCFSVFQTGEDATPITDQTITAQMPEARSSDTVDAIGDVKTAQLSKQNLSSLLAGVSRPENYTWEGSVEYISSDSTHMRIKTLQYVNKNRARLEAYKSGKLATLLLADDNFVYTVDPVTNKYQKTARQSDFSYDSMLSLANVGAILPIDTDSISNVEYIKLNGENVFYFEILPKQGPSQEKYWISADTGIPVRVESYIGDTLYYVFETTSFDESIPDESNFEFLNDAGKEAQ